MRYLSGATLNNNGYISAGGGGGGGGSRAEQNDWGDRNDEGGGGGGGNGLPAGKGGDGNDGEAEGRRYSEKKWRGEQQEKMMLKQVDWRAMEVLMVRDGKNGSGGKNK